MEDHSAQHAAMPVRPWADTQGHKALQAAHKRAAKQFIKVML